MDYTFGFTFKKLSSTMIGANKSHNLRLHSTSSQLTRKEAWITPQGHHTIVAWDDAKIELARGLAKRKDAVVVISNLARKRTGVQSLQRPFQRVNLSH